MFDNYKELAKSFRDVADCLDNLVALEERRIAGEDVEEEIQMAFGGLMIKMLALESMKNK